MPRAISTTNREAMTGSVSPATSTNTPRAAMPAAFPHRFQHAGLEPADADLPDEEIAVEARLEGEDQPDARGGGTPRRTARACRSCSDERPVRIECPAHVISAAEHLDPGLEHLHATRGSPAARARRAPRRAASGSCPL